MFERRDSDVDYAMGNSVWRKASSEHAHDGCSGTVKKVTDA